MSLTFGQSGVDTSQLITNFDALFSLSLANYGKGIADNVGTSNALFNLIKNSDFYEPCDGGTYITENLMYALAEGDSYEGYDELGDQLIDGITQAQFEWRQSAVPIQYSMKELIQNRNKLADLVKTKIMQSEMGFEESWAKWLLQGSGDAALATPKVSAVNGSYNIDPIAKLVHYTPSSALAIGNIDQSTSTWWRNQTKTSAATTFDGFLYEMDNLYNTCGLGTGGYPDLIWCDQLSYELYCHAWFNRYRQMPADVPAGNGFPFEAKKFKNARVVMDEKIPDVHSGLISTATYGTMYFLNTKFFRIRYLPERNFTMLPDENGKTFKKPLRGDSRIGHLAWMGNVTIKNRRKQGVFGKIPRTLAS